MKGVGTTRTAAEAALIVAWHQALSSAQGAGETLLAMRGDDNDSAEAMAQHNETMEDCRYVEQDEQPHTESAAIEKCEVWYSIDRIVSRNTINSGCAVRCRK